MKTTGVFEVLILLLLPAIVASIALASTQQPQGALPYSGNVFFNLPADVGAENVRVRQNGALLVTVSSKPELWQIDPTSNQVGQVIYTFPEANSAQGLVEVSKDFFAVLVGNQTASPEYSGTKGSWSVWTLDLQNYTNISTGNLSSIKASKVIEIPDAILMDGFAPLNRNGLLVAGDAQGGAIYSIDICAQKVTSVFRDEMLLGTNTSNSAGLKHIGINGLKVANDSVYFTNSAKQFLAKIPYDSHTGQATHDPAIIQQYNAFVDDFIITGSGDFLISEEQYGIVLTRSPAEKTQNDSVLLGNVLDADACTFGRTEESLCELYVTVQGETTSGVAKLNLSGSNVRDGC